MVATYFVGTNRISWLNFRFSFLFPVSHPPFFFDILFYLLYLVSFIQFSYSFNPLPFGLILINGPQLPVLQRCISSFYRLVAFTRLEAKDPLHKY